MQVSSIRKLVFTALMVGAIVSHAVAATPIRLVTSASEIEPFERWERIAAAFHADRPDYVLEVEVVSGNEYPTKVPLLIASGVPPDVVLTWGQYKAAWAGQGMLMDLTSLWDQSEVAQSASVFPFMMEAAIFDDKLVGVPYDFSMIPMTVNQDTLNDFGLALPSNDWTATDFRDYAIRLSRPELGVYGTTRVEINNTWIWAVNFTGNGWLSDDRTEVLVQEPGFIGVLDYWLELIALGATPPPGYSASRSIWEGGYALWPGWAHYGQNLEKTATYDWAMVAFPSGPAANLHFAHGHMFSIPYNAADPERGWVFLEWLLSYEGQRAIVTLDGRQPLSHDPELWDLFFSPVQSPAKRSMLYELVINTIYGHGRIHTMQYWDTWPGALNIMSKYIGDVFRGMESPRNAMDNAAVELRALISAQ